MNDFQNGVANLTEEIEEYTRQIEGKKTHALLLVTTVLLDLRMQVNIKQKQYASEVANVRSLSSQMIQIRQDIHDYHTKKDPRSKCKDFR